jgi:hypothetical protein
MSYFERQKIYRCKIKTGPEDSGAETVVLLTVQLRHRVHPNITQMRLFFLQFALEVQFLS